MAVGVGMVLGTSGNSRYWRRVISLTDLRRAHARRSKASRTDRAGQRRHAVVGVCTCAMNPVQAGPTPHIAASHCRLTASSTTASLHTKDRGAAHAHQL